MNVHKNIQKNSKINILIKNIKLIKKIFKIET